MTGTSSTESPMQHTPLYDSHVRLGAKMAEFGGWSMPIAYPTGTIAEHLACRSDAVMFDVSHLGTVRVAGARAFEQLQSALSNDLRKIGPGRAQYTHLLDEADGSVLDDIIVWWVDDDVFDVMPNASNTDRVVAAIGGRDTTSGRAVIAVQGPNAHAQLAELCPAAADVGRFRVQRVIWQGNELMVAGTGYTGERGVEIAVPAGAAERLWDELAAAGVMPAGLGARDTLRLEAGLPLHGHELGPGITPLQAGLGWVIGWNKPSFRGREALAREQAAGIQRRLVGIATQGRRPPREHSDVRVDGQTIGSVTSGNYSPTLEHGIALAFVPPEVVLGQAVTIDVRGSDLPGTVTATSFLP